MGVKKLTIKLFLIFLIGFAISLNLLQNYTSGDQTHYRIFYEKILGLSFFEVGHVAANEISSSEPLSWLILWLGANLGVEKDIWISLLNSILIVGLFLLLHKHEASKFAMLLMFTNFYFLVLITAAERLKISYIFFIYAFLMNSHKKYLFLALTPLAHLQSIVLLSGLILCSTHAEFRNIFKNLKIREKLLTQSVLMAAIAAALVFTLRDGIVSKINAYANSFSLVAYTNITVLLLIVCIASKNKLRMILAIFPMFIAIAAVGSDRINMVAVTLALGILTFERRLNHPLILLLLSYLTIKSIPFIINIYTHGDGFYNPANG